MRSVLVILFSIVLTSCASNEVMKPNTKIADNNGVVVASVTMNGRASDVWFYYRKSGETSEKRMDAVGLTMLTVPDDYPNEKNKKGRLLAFEAPVGKYDLTRWEIYIYTTGPGYIRPKKIEPLHFSVKAGQVTYLGNLHVDTLSGKNLFGIPIPVGGIASITDRKQIDLPILKKKYPNLAKMHVNISVPKVDKWGLK